MRSLNRFSGIRDLALRALRLQLWLVHGIRIPRSAKLSFSATLIPGKRGAISVGEHSLIAFKSVIIARRPSGEICPVSIGENCFVGGGSLILPGVSIGNGAIVGAGAVVFDDVPAHAIVAGNPARVLRTNVATTEYGRLQIADENIAKFWRE